MRLNLALDSEDPDIIVDLRMMNGANQPDKYSTLWEAVARLLNKNSAVDNRRQTEVLHMAVAFSVRDLIDQQRGGDLLIESRIRSTFVTTFDTGSETSTSFPPKWIRYHSEEILRCVG